MSCEYENCGKKTFATEALTGTKMQLCSDHFQQLFGKIIQNAEIVDEEDSNK